MENKKWKIATTTGDFSKFCKTDTERVIELHRAGFKYIDLNMYSFTPDCPYMRDDWKKEVSKIKELAEKLDMEFVQAHSQGGNPFNKDETEFIVNATLRSIEICRILGIKNTVVHPGFGKGLTKEEWFEKNKDFYNRLLPTAGKYGINILCENATKAGMGDMYHIYSGKDMREFIEFVGHPNFYGCWDTGHANCEGSQYDEIMSVGEYLRAIHYNDNCGETDQHLAPYMGTMNHDEVIHALIDVNFKGAFTLECSSSLREYRYWLGWRRQYDKDNRLSEPQLFMQRYIEKMLYETAEYILSAYNLL